MELNWKEDSNLIRKLAKILLGDTLSNGKPVSSIILLDDTSRAELQRWANMNDAEFAAAQRSGDSVRIDVDDVIRQLEENMLLTHSYLMICFRCLMQMIWNFGKKSVNGKILTTTSQRNMFSPIPILNSNRCRLTAPNTISGLTRLDISV